VVRVSGPRAFAAVAALAGPLPPPRAARLRTLRATDGAVLDRGLVLTFPGPRSATGEDVAELHLHAGRAVVAAVIAALLAQPGTRAAAAGEFTRRALANGVIDVAQAEGLADLLAAETERQRRAALAMAGGAIGRQVDAWRDAALVLAAEVEARIEFEEDDPAAVAAQPAQRGAADLRAAIGAVLARPPVERLHDGVRIVIAGPPNTGKSSLLNALAQRDAAIVTPIAGTTRDTVEAGVRRGGRALLLCDTAGLTDTDDPVEAIGVARAREAMATADVVLWTGELDAPAEAVRLHTRADLPDREVVPDGRVGVSVLRPESIASVWDTIDARVAALWPDEDALLVNARQRRWLAEAIAEIDAMAGTRDLLVLAEGWRRVYRALGGVTGRDATEQMLDRLFARFCIGK
jgi:tRNA modification GTPase